MSLKNILKTPLSSQDVRELTVGEMVYLSGEVIAMKTPGYARALDMASKGMSLPVDFEGAAIYHSFSALEETEKGMNLLYIGGTLSFRSNALAPKMIEELGVRAFIGKMGAPMSDEALRDMEKYGCVHLAQTGGVPAYNSSQIEGPIKIFWKDIVDEKCMIYRVHNMGPLIVSMDSRGGNFFQNIEHQKRISIENILKMEHG